MINHLIQVLAVIFIFGVLIISHELGHFWTARKCGVRVELFTFGFGNESPPGRQLDQKIRVVVGDVAVPVHIVQLEMHRQVVLAVGNHIAAILQKSGE